jgi:hypothetical protein
VHGILFLLRDRSVDGVQAQSVHVVAYGLQNQHVDHITVSNVDGIAGGLSVGIVDAVVCAVLRAVRRTGPWPLENPVDTLIDSCERPAAMRISQDPGGAGEVTGSWSQPARASATAKPPRFLAAGRVRTAIRARPARRTYRRALASASIPRHGATRGDGH